MKRIVMACAVAAAGMMSTSGAMASSYPLLKDSPSVCAIYAQYPAIFSKNIADGMSLDQVEEGIMYTGTHSDFSRRRSIDWFQKMIKIAQLSYSNLGAENHPGTSEEDEVAIMSDVVETYCNNGWNK